jgi:3-oxoacyl-[acyl-carrier protein] reductase
MKVDLNGKVALVTGAARGIGQAIADALAANGAVVVYSDLDSGEAAQAASRFPRASGVRLNVIDEAEVDAVLDAIAREKGSLDIVVNNAGVNTMAHRVTIDKFPSDEWRRILDVNLTGLYLVSRAAARIMRKQRSGRIINISSVAGIVPLRLQCPFVASKAGVDQLTRAMAIELGAEGILVNGIAPGSTLTEGTKKLFYDEGGQFRDSVQKLLDHIPLGRPGTTEEIANAALFLAAPESSYINGHVLVVDGGWTAGYAREF